MFEILSFQIKVGSIIGVLVLVYYFVLAKDVFFIRNRIWLLSTATVPWLLPLLPMPLKLRNLLYGVEEEVVQLPVNIVSEVNVVQTVKHTSSINWINLLLFFLVFVSLLLLIRLMWGYISIYKLKKESESSLFKGLRLRFINQEHIIPFSFFQTIYIPKAIKKRNDFQLILEHEASHCKYWHSVDIVLIELLLIIQWWNPFVWWLRKLIAQNHEYFVDNNVLKTVSHPKDYQYSLIDMVSMKSQLQLVNNFNQSFTKKRIVMMNRNINNKNISRLKFVVVVVVVAIAMSAFTDSSVELNRFNNNAEQFKQFNKSTMADNLIVDSSATKKNMYVVDGVEIGTELDLSPEDIKSVNVVKPPKSEELYGEKGKEGVVHVISKKAEIIYNAEDSIIYNKKSIEVYGSPKVQISNNKSGNNPLVYIDGIKKTIKDMKSLDSNNIQRVEILKDSSAIEKYGEEGKNGVILVYSKKSQISLKVKNSNIPKDYNPLVYIDGVKQSIDYLESLGSDRIESINVLKEASATAEYGEEGKNGVILVKTKK